jgi:hypothetical protein
MITKAISDQFSIHGCSLLFLLKKASGTHFIWSSAHPNIPLQHEYKFYQLSSLPKCGFPAFFRHGYSGSQVFMGRLFDYSVLFNLSGHLFYWFY